MKQTMVFIKVLIKLNDFLSAESIKIFHQQMAVRKGKEIIQKLDILSLRFETKNISDIVLKQGRSHKLQTKKNKKKNNLKCS